MANFNIDAIRDQIHTLDFERGTPTEVAVWREANEDSCANLVIEAIGATKIGKGCRILGSNIFDKGHYHM